MTPNIKKSDRRLPTTGPEQERYERYRFVATTNGRGIIHHVDETGQWIEAGSTLALEDWR